MKLIIKNFEDELHYLIKCDSSANSDNAIDIWMKFANYLTPEESLFMYELKIKDLDNLSQTEFDTYYRIKNQLRFSKLLPKYKNESCTKEEHDFVSKYMNTSLRSFVKSKVSEKQQNSANKIISDLFGKNELEQYIELQQEQYDNLNIYEAYILFIAKEKRYNEIQQKTTKKIRDEQLEREIRLRRNLIKEYGHNF